MFSKHELVLCHQVVMKIFLILFVTCLHSHLKSQTIQACHSIDFETILESAPSDGQIIDSQFQDTFGLSFSLEPGGFPVLAQVGGNQTAFSSIFGPDTPAPNQNIDSYFLTDDGILSGLISPPIILDFESPIDSFGLCILDIDFGELFIIHGRDIDEQVILIDTILPTDPNTGDGLSTCWGFNLADCAVPVHSIRLEGLRVQSGAFGMGIDNLSFCLAESDISNDVEIESTLVTCSGELGSIHIQNFSGEDLVYAIDGINFLTDTIFDSLDVGLYTIAIQEVNGCQTIFENIRIEEESIPLSTQVNASNTTCNLSNGSLTISTSISDDLTYSFEGVNFQGDSTFTDLSPGNYTVIISDSRGCMDVQNVSILPSEEIIVDILTTPDWCNDTNGIITITASGGVGNLFYSINDGSPQLGSIFSQLKEDVYTILVQDSIACSISEQVFIDAGESIITSDVQVNDLNCENTSGSISINNAGGNGTVSYSINGAPPTLNPTFNNLQAGDFSIIIRDDQGCQDSLDFSLDLPVCPIYIPNTFSPQSDGINDLFKIFTNGFYDVEVLTYAIYGRWGEEIWRTNNFTIHTANQQDYWDGSFRGQECTPDVYVYKIEVRHLNGSVEVYTGDVTLVR